MKQACGHLPDEDAIFEVVVAEVRVKLGICLVLFEFEGDYVIDVKSM